MKPRTRPRGGGGGNASQMTERVATIIAGAIVLAAAAGIGILLLALGRHVVDGFLGNDRLVVREIRVEGNQVLEEREVAALTGVKLGAPIRPLDLGKVKEGVSRHPRIADVVVEKRLPQTLVVRIEERHPVALVQESGVIKGIDTFGVIVPLVPSREEMKGPIITGSVRQISADLRHDALTAIGAMPPPLLARISEVRVDEQNGLTLITTGQPTVIRLGQGDVLKKIKKLEQALAAFDRRNEVKQCIDLRFEDIIAIP